MQSISISISFLFQKNQKRNEGKEKKLMFISKIPLLGSRDLNACHDEVVSKWPCCYGTLLVDPSTRSPDSYAYFQIQRTLVITIVALHRLRIVM
jgi:hypothetical protein